MTTDQLSLLSGDLASQRSFVLGALINDALAVIRRLPARTTPADEAIEAHALRVLAQAADELRRLPVDQAVPF